MAEFNELKFVYFTYPLYDDVNKDMLFREGLPIDELKLDFWATQLLYDENRLEQYLASKWRERITSPNKNAYVVKGYAVIKIPEMFLLGLGDNISVQEGLTWKGFMPYIKPGSSYKPDVYGYIIPTLIQAIYTVETGEWNPNPDYSIYYHPDGLTFDKHQIKQMRALGYGSIANAAEKRKTAPSYECLLSDDTIKGTFSREKNYYQGLLFTPEWIQAKTRRKKRIIT